MIGAMSGPSTPAVRPQLDLMAALAAGAEAWSDGHAPGPQMQHIEALAILASASWPVALMATGVTPTGPRELVLLAVLWAAVIVLLAPILGGANTRSRLPRSPVAMGALRVTCVVAAVVAGGALVPTRALLGAWPLGVAAGIDVTRTALAIGVIPEPWAWWRLIMRSAPNLVLVAMVVGALVIDPPQITRLRVVVLYGTGVGLTAIGALTSASALKFRTMQMDQLDEQRRVIVAAEFRNRGHWLHDDVCSELRLTRLRLDSGLVSPEQVASELDALDHRLRLRQLDEFIGAGSVRVAEVVQPFLRHAQQRGITLVDTPSLDTAGRTIGGESAQLLRRVMAVLVANAEQAGATTLGVRLTWDGDHLVVEVADDAGGSPPDSLPPGRGLDVLRDQLGDNSLHITGGERGVVVRAVIRGAGHDAPQPATLTPGTAIGHRP